MTLYRIAALFVGISIATAGMSQNAAAPKRSLDDIVNSADNPFKVRNAPKATSDLDTERMLMQMGRKPAASSGTQCVKLSAEALKACKAGSYVGLCLRNQTLAAQNRQYCENYKREGCADACKSTEADPAATAREEREATDYMKSLSSPSTNTTIDARASCLKRNPGKRLLCGYKN